MQRARRGRLGVAVGIVVVVIGAGTAGAQTGSGPPAAPTTIQPSHGRAFIPVLGDWEGTVGGFPASFSLVRTAATRRAPAGLAISELVAFHPSGCPVSAARPAEGVLGGSDPQRLGTAGSLGLSTLGFGGRLTGSRAAILTRQYGFGACHGRLTWHMHPARRRPVSNGTWTVRYGGDVSGRFRVIGGGRLAAGLPLPPALGLCAGLSGTIDAFIGARGAAVAVDAGLRLSLHFAGGRATGTLQDAGPGCSSRSVRVSASG